MQARSEIRCPHCGRGIISDNYLIHEARCQLMSSRVGPAPNSSSKINEQQGRSKIVLGGDKEMSERQIGERGKAQPNQHRPARQPDKVPGPEIKFNYSSGIRANESESQVRPPPSFLRERPREKIFRNSEPQQQRIPCTFCGYKQTLLELDTHPNQCEHRTEECAFCHFNFPRSLMADHEQVCPQSPRYSHIHEEPGFYEDEEEEEEEDYFGNFSRFVDPRRSNRRGSRGPIFEEPEEQNFTYVLQSGGRGGYQRRVIFSEPRYNRIEAPQRRPSPFHQDMQHNPFLNFFNLLNFMAARNSHHEIGLNKQEIRKLKRIKYRGKGDGEKDLCTICYCEFEELEKVMELKCKHLYHEECIVKWLEKNPKCPVCKQSQTDREMEIEE